MRDHIISILLWCQFICCLDDTVDDRCDLVAWKLFKNTLDDAASSAVAAQILQLCFNQRQQELDVLCRKIKHHALQNVITFLAKHHTHQLRRLELLNYLEFSFERKPDQRLLDDAAPILIVSQSVNLL